MEFVKNEKSEGGEVANQVAPCYRTNGPGGAKVKRYGARKS